MITHLLVCPPVNKTMQKVVDEYSINIVNGAGLGTWNNQLDFVGDLHSAPDPGILFLLYLLVLLYYCSVFTGFQQHCNTVNFSDKPNFNIVNLFELHQCLLVPIHLAFYRLPSKWQKNSIGLGIACKCYCTINNLYVQHSKNVEKQWESVIVPIRVNKIKISTDQT